MGAAISVSQRTGLATVWNQIIIFLLSQRMIIPGIAGFPNVVAGEIGEAAQDDEGLEKVRELGQRVTELAKRLT